MTRNHWVRAGGRSEYRLFFTDGALIRFYIPWLMGGHSMDGMVPLVEVETLS